MAEELKPCFCFKKLGEPTSEHFTDCPHGTRAEPVVIGRARPYFECPRCGAAECRGAKFVTLCVDCASPASGTTPDPKTFSENARRVLNWARGVHDKAYCRDEGCWLCADLDALQSWTASSSSSGEGTE